MTLKTFENKIQELGYKKGCVNGLELINTSNEKNILESLQYEYDTIYYTYQGNVYIATISTVDNEKDLEVQKARNYFHEFGVLEDAFDSGDITKEQYIKLGGIL